MQSHYHTHLISVFKTTSPQTENTNNYNTSSSISNIIDSKFHAAWMHAQTCIMILSILNYTADIFYSFQVQFLRPAVLLVVVVRYINADMHIHHDHSILTTDLDPLVPEIFGIIYGATVLFLL